MTHISNADHQALLTEAITYSLGSKPYKPDHEAKAPESEAPSPESDAPEPEAQVPASIPAAGAPTVVRKRSPKHKRPPEEPIAFEIIPSPPEVESSPPVPLAASPGLTAQLSTADHDPPPVEPSPPRVLVEGEPTPARASPSTGEHPSFLAEVGFVRMDEVAAEPIDWMWEDRIPAGMVSLLDGRPDTGKTTLMCAIAADITQGREPRTGDEGEEARALQAEGPVSGGAAREPRSVIVVTSENSFANVLKPRLKAAGADMTRCIGWKSTQQMSGMQDSPRFPRDIDALEQAIVSYKAALVIIDPMTAHMDPGLSLNQDTSARQVLTPLAQLAERTGAAILIVRHLQKAANGDAINAGAGSIGVIGSVRVQLVVGPHPDGSEEDPDRFVAVGKSNIGPKPATLSFRIVGARIDGAQTSRVQWGADSTLTASDLTRKSRSTGNGAISDEVGEWLRTLLSDGPCPAQDVQEAAKAEGYAVATLNRVKRKIGVRSVRAGFGPDSVWVWELPPGGSA